MLKTLSIAAAITLAGMTPTIAQEAPAKTPSDRATALMMDSWTPNLDAVAQALGERHGDIDWARFDTYLMDGVIEIDWGLCGTLFANPEDKNCDRGSVAQSLTLKLREYVLTDAFAEKVMTNEAFLDDMIEDIGKGRIRLLLEPLQPLYTNDLDLTMNIRYIGWMGGNCHIRLDGGQTPPPEGKLTREECLEHRFTVYLKETFCPEDDRDVCLANAGWGYGFLIRRFLDGDEEAVAAWQELMRHTAAKVGIELPASDGG